MTTISDETNTEKIEHKSKKNMLLGTIFGYIAIGVSILYGFFLTPEIVSAVGESNYGLYGLTASITNLLLVDFGLSNTINTYLAKLRADNDKEGVEKFLAAIFKLYLFADIVFIVIIGSLYFSAPYIFKAYSPVQVEVLQYLILIVGGFALISVPCSCFSAVMSTYEKFSIIKLVDIVQKVLYTVFSILSVVLGWGIIGIVVANVATGLFSVILRFLYMRFYIGIRLDLRLGVSRDDLKSILSFSSWGLIIAICSRLVITITPFILSVVTTNMDVTFFSLVITIETYIFMFGEMVSGFFLAKIARTDHEFGSEEEKRAHLQALVEKIGKIEFLVIALIIAGFVSVGQEFIVVWMEKQTNTMDYLIIYWCILFICGYEVIHIPQLALQNAMYTHGHIAPLAIAQMAKAAVNLILSFSLAYWFSYTFNQDGTGWQGAGAFGASIAICSACIVELIITNIMYKKYLHISLSHYFGSIYVGGGITLAVTITVGLVLHFFMPLNDHMAVKLLVDGVIVVFVYCIYTFYFTFNRKERHNYRDTLIRLLHLKIVVKEKKEIIQTKQLSKKLRIALITITVVWSALVMGGIIYMFIDSILKSYVVMLMSLYLAAMPILAINTARKINEAQTKKDLIMPIIATFLLSSIITTVILIFLPSSSFKEIENQQQLDNAQK